VASSLTTLATSTTAVLALPQSGFTSSFTLGSASGTGVGAQPAQFSGSAYKNSVLSGGVWAAVGGMAVLIM